MNKLFSKWDYIKLFTEYYFLKKENKRLREWIKRANLKSPLPQHEFDTEIIIEASRILAGK